MLNTSTYVSEYVLVCLIVLVRFGADVLLQVLRLDANVRLTAGESEWQTDSVATDPSYI